MTMERRDFFAVAVGGALAAPFVLGTDEDAQDARPDETEVEGMTHDDWQKLCQAMEDAWRKYRKNPPEKETIQITFRQDGSGGWMFTAPLLAWQEKK